MKNQLSRFAFAAMATCLALPGSAFGAKYFGADITPTSVSAGATGVSLSLTIMNCNNTGICSGFTTNGQDPIQSAKVQIPVGFTVSGTPGYSTSNSSVWTVSVVSNEIRVVKVGSAKLAPGDALTLNITANATCTAGPNVWTTSAFNSDDLVSSPYTLVGTGTQTVTITGSCGIPQGLFLTGDYCSYSQGGWGATPRGHNPGMILSVNFGPTYPSGVQVGGTNWMKFTTSSAVDAYLPAGSTPDQLVGTLTDPTSTTSGVFGGQVLTLRLNLDLQGVIHGTQGSIGSLKLTGTGGSLDGKTIPEILTAAETALGGGGLPSGYTFATLNNLIDLLNNAFDNCVPSDWAQAHLTAS